MAAATAHQWHGGPATAGGGSSYDGGVDGDDFLTEYDYYEDDYVSPGAAAGDSMTEEELREAMMRRPGMMMMPSLQDILSDCIEQTVPQAMLHIGKALFWCLVFRITTQTSE